MKRRNNYYYQRWILSGFAGVITIMFIHLLCFPLNQKEPSSLNWFEQIIANSDLQKPASDGDFWGYITTSLRIAITPILGSLFGLSLVSLSLNKRNNNTWENQYLKNKKTIWTILKDAIPFILFLPTSLILLAYISVIIQGKTFLWNALPQMLSIGIVGGIIIYIFLLLASD
ncbi:MAG: hypothetical protein AAFV71_14955 [Cyanobacteria bacterium J06633_8]